MEEVTGKFQKRILDLDRSEVVENVSLARNLDRAYTGIMIVLC